MPGRLEIPQEEDRPQVLERLRKMVQQWPKVSGYHLNPDAQIVEGIVGALVRSVMKYGYPFCPCRDLSGDFEKDRANICPCKWHHREVREDSHCKCVLFVSDKYDPDKAYNPKVEDGTVSTVESIRHRWVTAYVTNWCAFSRRSQAVMQQLGVPFDRVDVERDAAAAKKVEQLNRGFRSVPTIVVRMIVTEPYTAELESVLLRGQARLLSCTAYITSWCAHSRRTLAWLKQNQIQHDVIDIERDREAASRVQTWNKGYLSTPTLDITLCVTEPSTEQLKTILGFGAL
jgi:ferredoxin-thioredoxin reductase catalytic chain